MGHLLRRFIYFEVSRNNMDYNQLPLQFTVLTGGKILWKGSSSKEILYSKNNEDWVAISSSSAGTEISVSADDVIKIKATNASGYNGCSFLVSDGATFNAEGNIMSIIDQNTWNNVTTLPNYNNLFRGLFSGCTGLISATNLILPAISLKDNCYMEMFKNCTNLTKAPALPATTLAQTCYRSMFESCTSLITAPNLPATTLVLGCYWDMFKNCSTLIATPTLLATTLATSCYQGMFYNCANLTQVSELPATTLTDSCYRGMFRACTKLTTAPILPATTLVFESYRQMFEGDTLLNYIKCLATDMTATDCLNSWVRSVASSGTFVKDASATTWTTGNTGIPSGWTVVDAS